MLGARDDKADRHDEWRGGAEAAIELEHGTEQ